MAETKRTWYEEVDEICQFRVEISADDHLHLAIADDQVQRHLRFSCTPEEYMNGAMADHQQSIRQLIGHNMSLMVVTEIEQEVRRIIANPARELPKQASSPVSVKQQFDGVVTGGVHEPASSPVVEKQEHKSWWEFWK